MAFTRPQAPESSPKNTDTQGTCAKTRLMLSSFLYVQVALCFGWRKVDRMINSWYSLKWLIRLGQPLSCVALLTSHSSSKT